mgnify:CR=1 FL=1
MATEVGSEKGVGATVILSLIALGGAVVMYVGAGDPLSGWGFAAAMLAGSLAVVAAHLW